MTYRGDGDLDLLLHFSIQDLATVLTSSSTEVTLEGETFDGVPVEGTDSVRIIKKSRS
ncbi:MAG: hypothetical protein LUQ37_11295 [Methanoregulaceae archaeon]|jgi:hypothetical protein|nr:hypothetical protein [Methanoregulaceae archaeon]